MKPANYNIDDLNGAEVTFCLPGKTPSARGSEVVRYKITAVHREGDDYWLEFGDWISGELPATPTSVVLWHEDQPPWPGWTLSTARAQSSGALHLPPP